MADQDGLTDESIKFRIRKEDDLGRDCRDAVPGLSKTCAKHGIPLWDYRAAGWACGAPGLFRLCQTSFAAEDSRLECSRRPGFCRGLPSVEVNLLHYQPFGRLTRRDFDWRGTKCA